MSSGEICLEIRITSVAGNPDKIIGRTTGEVGVKFFL
jgi:hypothetical protein